MEVLVSEHIWDGVWAQGFSAHWVKMRRGVCFALEQYGIGGENGPGGTRTHMGFTPADFKSAASANSATGPWWGDLDRFYPDLRSRWHAMRINGTPIGYVGVVDWRAIFTLSALGSRSDLLFPISRQESGRSVYFCRVSAFNLAKQLSQGEKTPWSRVIHMEKRLLHHRDGSR